MFGFYRIAAVTPQLSVADVSSNLKFHLDSYKKAVENGASLVVFPELSLTGATCGDLFRQSILLDAAWRAAGEFAAATEDCIAVFGLPVLAGNGIYNVAAIAGGGRLLALIPKRRSDGVFRSGAGIISKINGIAFIDGAVWDCGFRFSVEIGSDRLAPDSGISALYCGAQLIVNPLAEAARAGFDASQEAASLSGRFGGVYVTAAAGYGESTTDSVFAGDSRIGDRGRCVASAEPFNWKSSIIFYDADMEAVRFCRASDQRFSEIPGDGDANTLIKVPESADIRYAFNPANPFLPETNLDAFCESVLTIQSSGLAKRMEHTGAKTMVVGVSGGLDSTLALVVMARCRGMLNGSVDMIKAFTLPGFGTSDRTYGNAGKLCSALDIELEEIDITKACVQHFSDLGHDGKKADAVFENAQARERTQILMDAANMYNGVLVGTGDLSELALGWCTYNGDQMSMYSVNGSIPKTMIPVLLEYEARRLGSDEFTAVVSDIINTPISPELLPLSDDGTLEQKTEDVVGPYELHDFFIYHTLSSGASPEKLVYMAQAAFGGRYLPDVIRRWCQVFGKRFITQQFKRSAMPDGALAGGFSLSPRGAWSMPSDASPALWM